MTDIPTKKAYITRMKDCVNFQGGWLNGWLRDLNNSHLYSSLQFKEMLAKIEKYEQSDAKVEHDYVKLKNIVECAQKIVEFDHYVRKNLDFLPQSINQKKP